MAPKAGDPVQEQLIQARRNQILDAATTVFAQKGFHRATIRDIASVAGIADGTIYNYFGNKNDLMLGILARLNEYEQREESYEQAARGDIKTFVRGYIRQRFRRIEQTGFEVFQALLPELLVDSDLREIYFQQVIEPTYALTEKYLQEWADQGLIRLSDVRLSMRIIGGMAMGLIILRIMGDPELESRWDEIPDLIADFMLQGIEEVEGK